MSEISKVMRYYDCLSSVYEELYGLEQYLKYDVIVGRYGDYFKRARIIVDLGCGCGLFYRYLLSRGFIGPEVKYIGLDISVGMLRVFRRFCPRCLLINGVFEVCPLICDVADVITCISAIGGFEKVKILLSEIVRVLRREGISIITLRRELKDVSEKLKENAKHLDLDFEVFNLKSEIGIALFKG